MKEIIFVRDVFGIIDVVLWECCLYVNGFTCHNDHSGGRKITEVYTGIKYKIATATSFAHSTGVVS